MLTIPETLHAHGAAAQHKVDSLHHPGRFLVSGMLAGFYIGVGVVLMVSTAGPLAAAGDGLAKLVAGLVFGVALTIVVFAGADLLTSAMMIIPQGLLMRSVRPWPALGALAFTLVANLLGAVIFAALIVASGVLHANAPAGRMLADMLAAKAHETPLELITRGILCNVLVCLAIWMSNRLKDDVAKILVIFAAILAFIASGFEHVVANMTTYALGLLGGIPEATLGLFASNVLWVGLGNLIGGAVVVGAGYWLIGGRPRATDLTGAPHDTPMRGRALT